MFLARGDVNVNVNMEDFLDDTPLQTAVLMHDKEILKLILSRMDLDMKSDSIHGTSR